jgi:5-methylcytosine-specific restriction protein A
MRAPGSCREAECDQPVPFGQQCPVHGRKPRRPDDRRPTAPERGYDSVKWRRIRAAFLKVNTECVDCGAPAAVPDHDPVSRRDLVAQGDPHPDAWHHLRPRCIRCHNRRTGLTGQ